MTSGSQLSPEGDILKRKLRYMLNDVGVAEFNHAHGRIVDYIVDLQEVIDAVENEAPTESQWLRIEGAHRALDEYVQTHFREEEAALEARNFFAIRVHKEQHRRFEAEVAEVGRKIGARDVSVTVGLKDFLLDWLFKHINQVDMKYKETFAQAPL